MEWYEENYHPRWRQRIAIERVVHEGRTEHQEVMVFENGDLGRVLVLDGVVQTTERDEFIYHEMLAHVPIVAHGACRDVLIIGGGDGGLLEEVLKHESVRHVTMVELDPGVIEVSRTYLPGVGGGAFDDPRLRLIVGDGAAFVRQQRRQQPDGARFDVIIVDSTDPVGGPGDVLYGEAFYADGAGLLRPGGVFANQSGNPFLERDRLPTYRARAGRHFADASFYTASVPSYLGGLFAFGWASDDPAKRRLTAAELAQRSAPESLRYYTPAVHAAAFAHPPFLSG